MLNPRKLSVPVRPTANPFSTNGNRSPIAVPPRVLDAVGGSVRQAPIVAPPMQQQGWGGWALPVANAMRDYEEPGDPFTAAAMGFLKGRTGYEEQAKVQGMRDTVAETLAGHPDIQKWVSEGIVDPSSALEMAAKRDEVLRKKTEETEKRSQIIDYLRQAGDDDIADAFEAGAIDEDGIAKAVAERDKAADLPKVTVDAGAREQLADQQGLTGEERKQFILTGDLPKSAAVGGEPPPNYRWKGDGTLEPIPGGPADPANPLNIKKPAGGGLTEGQAKTGGYAQRMENAENELGTMLSGNPDFDPALASANPLSGEFWDMLNRKYGPNQFQSPEYQQYRTAASEWIRSKLRKESGAAISTQEWDTEFDTYFPQPGDSPEEIELKTRLRANALESVKGESRGGYEHLFGEDGEPLPDGGAGGLPDGVTEEDIQHTMQVHGLTREEVLERLQ